jgi:ribosomal protein S8
MSFGVLLLLNQLKICYKHKKNSAKILRTRLNQIVLERMQRQGFISYFKLNSDRKYFLVFFNSLSVLNNFFIHLQVKSKPSRVIYISYDNLVKKYKPSDFFILLTVRGILISEEVFFFKIGGVLICDSFSFK